jgi:hypothetical protein
MELGEKNTDRPLRIILTTVSVLILGVGVLAAYEFRSWTRHTLNGPRSGLGYRALIRVSDSMPINVGSDFYADVDILDSDEKVVFSWEDSAGQDSYGAIKDMRNSMSWTDEKTLSFRCRTGCVAIQRQPSGQWSHRYCTE